MSDEHQPAEKMEAPKSDPPAKPVPPDIVRVKGGADMNDMPRTGSGHQTPRDE